MPEVRDYSWGTYRDVKSEKECFENLSNAIIEQAIADMANAVMRRELSDRDVISANKTFVECAKFFSGDYIKTLTKVDPGLIMDAAIKQGHYMVWKHDRGCSKCKYARSKKCPHGKSGAANWYAWSKGERTCIYTDKTVRANKPDVAEMPDAF